MLQASSHFHHNRDNLTPACMLACLFRTHITTTDVTRGKDIITHCRHRSCWRPIFASPLDKADWAIPIKPPLPCSCTHRPASSSLLQLQLQLLLSVGCIVWCSWCRTLGVHSGLRT